MQQKQNNKQWPQVYSCKFLTAGLVSYEDSGAGIALLKKETIDRMLLSFIGKPVIIDHQDVSAENFKASAKGYVTAVRFCPEDGWFYADFILDDDQAIKCVEEDGYSVSCAYNVLDSVEGGTYQDIPYDGEITEGSFTHLALVMQPRYEESKIMKNSPMMLVNSKQAKYVQTSKQENKMDMFKIFKKNAKTGEKEAYTGMVVNVEGVGDVPVDHLIKNYADMTAAEAADKVAKEEKAGKENAKVYMNSTDIVDINGNKVSIAEMTAKYKVFKEAKQNEKKNCTCNAKEGEEHKEGCVMNKKNDKEDDRKEELKEEEKKLEKANEKEEEKKEEKEEAKNEKGAHGSEDNLGGKVNEKQEEKKEEKENSKAKGQEFFAELHNASIKVPEESGARVLPMTRSERAAAWKARNAKQQ